MLAKAVARLERALGVRLFHRTTRRVAATPEGEVLTWNTGAQEILGWPADEIIGRHFSVFYPPEDRAKPAMELREAKRHG